MLTMLVETTSGLRETRTHNLDSLDPKEIVAFLKKSGLTAGFCIAFGLTSDGKVVEMVKDGYFNQGDVKHLQSLGVVEWAYSWAFAGKNFKLANGEIVKVSATYERMKRSTLDKWARALR